MFGLGFSEILLIAAVLLVVVGPERLPQFMRTAGKYYGQLRRASEDLRRAFVVEVDRVDAEERYRKLQERRQQAEEARKQALAAAGQGTVAVAAPAVVPEVLPVDVVDVDPETPALRIPPGVTEEEWRTLPPHVQQLLQRSERT